MDDHYPLTCESLWSESDRLFHSSLAVMTEDTLIVKIADEVSASMAQPLWNRLHDDGIYDANRIQRYVAEHRLIYETTSPATKRQRLSTLKTTSSGRSAISTSVNDKRASDPENRTRKRSFTDLFLT
ncbi:hypothetical protein RBU55_17895 [Pseudomonas chlororaphis subsp. aurantiaca]|uniref:FCD domain-containing protein n=1 Tax=Pseudomonas chlororaphis TaxID=587753 RepID=UPI0027DCE807|nr:hypothetical protein [Pseudomonas chlororaphis]WMI97450.1 hypothetical protein RBU55_17895 [Pseudomonas chlororaphis subsp. aurantiaca]